MTAISDDIAYTVPTEIRPGTVVGTHCGEGYQVAINAVCQDDRTWRVQGQCVQSEFGNKMGMETSVCLWIESERVSVYINTTSKIGYVHIIYYCSWKDARIEHNLKSLHVPSPTTGTTSCNCPPTNTAVIAVPITISMVILLVGITLLVINVILIVKRKRHTPTVQYDKKSKVQVYDEVDDYDKSTKDTKVYQELDVNKMDDTKQYATIK